MPPLSLFLGTANSLEYPHTCRVDKMVHNAILNQSSDSYRPSVENDREKRAQAYREQGGVVYNDGTISPGHFADQVTCGPTREAYAAFQIVDYPPCPGCDRISSPEAIDLTLGHVAGCSSFLHVIATTFVPTFNKSCLLVKRLDSPIEIMEALIQRFEQVPKSP